MSTVTEMGGVLQPEGVDDLRFTKGEQIDLSTVLSIAENAQILAEALLHGNGGLFEVFRTGSTVTVFYPPERLVPNSRLAGLTLRFTVEEV